MMIFKRFFDRHYGYLRSLRILYILYNILNYSKLKRNKSLYHKYGIRKLLWWSLSGKDFIGKKGEPPWLDKPDAKETLISHLALTRFKPNLQAELLNWHEKGYMVLEGFFQEKEVEAINEEINRMLSANEIYLNFSEKQIISTHKKSNIINQIIRENELNHILEFILGKKVEIFQSINFLKGSEINPHSDFFHMSTFPYGHSIAVWIALEDIDECNGPLIIYPGSHKLAYIHSHDFVHSNNFFQIDPNLYAKYENKIMNLINTYKLQCKEFYAKKGDILIWHGNLLHGGAAIKNKNKTRKSMVIHYFAKEAICYHEITQRPAIQ
jgi:ectoine hydroxylase-related dioxygenase (phytanoyl-CoA dioxygenase family)